MKYVCLLVFLCSSFTLSADETNRKADLVFSWPDGFKAEVIYTRKRTKEVSSLKKEQSLRGSYKLFASQHPQGLLISFTDLEIDLEGAETAQGTQALLQHFITKASSVMPNYVVNDRGELIRIEGLEELQKIILADMEQITAEYPQRVKKQLSGIVNKVISKEQLQANISTQWNRVVGQWAGRSFEMSEAYETKYTSPIPMLDNLEVPMKATYRYIGQVPCNDQDNMTLCVELEMKSYTDSERLRKAIEQFVKEQGDSSVNINSLSIDYTVRLITEPQTLIPHRMKSTKVIRSYSTTQEGKDLTGIQTDEIVINYKYK